MPAVLDVTFISPPRWLDLGSSWRTSRDNNAGHLHNHQVHVVPLKSPEVWAPGDASPSRWRLAMVEWRWRSGVKVSPRSGSILPDQRRAVLYTSADTDAGQELLFDYGENYWRGREHLIVE